MNKFMLLLDFGGFCVVLAARGSHGTVGMLLIGLGKTMLTPEEVERALFNGGGDTDFRHIVWNLRLPRALIAIVAGSRCESYTFHPSYCCVRLNGCIRVCCWCNWFYWIDWSAYCGSARREETDLFVSN